MKQKNWSEIKKAFEDLDPELHAFGDEMAKAQVRIGEVGSKSRLQWLLNFVHLDLHKISTGDWINLRFEFLEFHHYGETVIVGSGGFDDEDPMSDPTKEDIGKFHSSVRKKLNSLIDENEVQFDIEYITINLTPRFKPVRNEDGKYFPWTTIPSSRNKWGASQYNLSALIVEYAHLIRRCPECQKFFLADRKNQLFCSAKHKGYAAVRKYRKSKGLITGRKRGRPRKQDTPKKEGMS